METRVLLVEDHPDTLELLTLVLTERFLVVGCGSAVEALRSLETVPPDVVVLDIGMAPVDGLECLQAIRGVPGYEKVPAIALTAHAREVDQERFLAAGFDAVVTKPVLDADALVTTIMTAALATSDRDRRALTRRSDFGILRRRGEGRASAAGAA